MTEVALKPELSHHIERVKAMNLLVTGFGLIIAEARPTMWGDLMDYRFRMVRSDNGHTRLSASFKPTSSGELQVVHVEVAQHDTPTISDVARFLMRVSLAGKKTLPKPARRRA